jgi:hypothetical protein
MEPDCQKCGAILTEQIQKVACGNNCHECGRYAYLAEEPSYLYLLTNPSIGLHKVGIGTVGKDNGRLQELIQEGWSVYGIWHASEKRRTFRWERAVFKELQVRIAMNKSENSGLVGRSDKHWVESISSQIISVLVVAELISTIVQDHHE